jgi:hypothetical protein
VIDDQHADLDAGKELLVGRPPSRSRRPEIVALAAAIGLVAVVGGVMYGISAARGGDTKLDRVAPNPDGQGLTAQESGNPHHPPPPGVVITRGPNGEIIYVTVTPTPGTPTPAGSPTGSAQANATATKQAPAPPPGTTVAVPAPPQTTSAAPPPVQQTTDGQAQTTPPPDPTTVAPTTPAGESAGAGGATGDQGGAGDTDPIPTDPVTVVDAPIATPASDVVPVDGTTAP